MTSHPSCQICELIYWWLTNNPIQYTLFWVPIISFHTFYSKLAIAQDVCSVSIPWEGTRLLFFTPSQQKNLIICLIIINIIFIFMTKYIILYYMYLIHFTFSSNVLKNINKNRSNCIPQFGWLCTGNSWFLLVYIT